MTAANKRGTIPPASPGTQQIESGIEIGSGFMRSESRLRRECVEPPEQLCLAADFRCVGHRCLANKK
jgi:hypothetical protein